MPKEQKQLRNMYPVERQSQIKTADSLPPIRQLYKEVQQDGKIVRVADLAKLNALFNHTTRGEKGNEIKKQIGEFNLIGNSQQILKDLYNDFILNLEEKGVVIKDNTGLGVLKEALASRGFPPQTYDRDVLMNRNVENLPPGTPIPAMLYSPLNNKNQPTEIIDSNTIAPTNDPFANYNAQILPSNNLKNNTGYGEERSGADATLE